MTHILLVEDEVKLARFLELELNYQGYQVSVAYDGLTAVTAAQKLHPDLVIVDWTLQGLSGYDTCHRLRSIDKGLPIILLTVKDETSDRIAGLDADVDDRLVKPVCIEDLVTIIRTHLRKSQVKHGADILEFEDLSLNRLTRKVYRGQRLIDLTEQEFELLEYLLIHPRQIITSDRILAEVWSHNFIADSQIVEMSIRYLRQKLEANNEKPLLQTLHGIGYVLYN
ncbi:response regulator transcription factor [Calothrix sp. FACHB-1219]|uniref:response regulator transcription factor n=1 Tax=unclassified Calothrix TaxID=2619626 RepID=UPI00168789FA|nr:MULTISPECIES: response regulator transcription factor [unclassified Calothrix]MBD2204790.1 response regulator transcription factor [Calothrix sp. FACHB-168]MBD2218062.1 response regulator transcription factor [Calothrix sp. FACHB-1219]